MTREEILVMKPGREMDALIYAMMHDGTIPKEGDNRYDMMPCYSTDIAAAWEVVKNMKRCGWGVHIDSFWAPWPVTFYRPRIKKGQYKLEKKRAVGDTVSEAICKAALLTVTKEEGGEQNA